jgi:hypothetical protein
VGSVTRFSAGIAREGTSAGSRTEEREEEEASVEAEAEPRELAMPSREASAREVLLAASLTSLREEEAVATPTAMLRPDLVELLLAMPSREASAREVLPAASLTRPREGVEAEGSLGTSLLARPVPAMPLPPVTATAERAADSPTSWREALISVTTGPELRPSPPGRPRLQVASATPSREASAREARAVASLTTLLGLALGPLLPEGCAMHSSVEIATAERRVSSLTRWSPRGADYTA